MPLQVNGGKGVKTERFPCTISLLLAALAVVILPFSAIPKMKKAYRLMKYLWLLTILRLCFYLDVG